MTRPLPETRAAFRTLHASGCFVLPNPWDVGSARMLQSLGFSALASTSAGYAWTTGRPDYAVTRDDVLGHLAILCAAVDLPVNADFESGFAIDPERVAENVALAVGTGVAGLSIEDRDGTPAGLHDLALSVERIRAARAAIDGAGGDVILVARTEGLLIDPAALTPAIDKLVAFAEAGADCLYAPGVRAGPTTSPRWSGPWRRSPSTCWSWIPRSEWRSSPILACAGSASAARSHAPPGAGCWPRPGR